jgi:glycosyltransferase involved in cell wall biosynthesis
VTRPGAAVRAADVDRIVTPVRPASTERLRIAVVAPVAQALPPTRSGSVESVTALLVEGLVADGHDVTLFATGSSRTSARLHATFARGYHDDPDLWPWEVCELMNLAAAVERADAFDVVHYQAEYAPISLALGRLSRAPLVTTLHHAPSAAEVAMWSRYPEAPFIAVSRVQAELLGSLNVIGTVHHAVDTDVFAPRGRPEGYLLFLGRFTEGKGVLQAVDIARRTDRRLLLAAAANEYYERTVAPLVDGRRVVHVGELGQTDKAALLAAADALLYPVQTGEPFGLVLAEAAACGTPVAALRRGAVPELVDDGVTGRAFATTEELVEGLAEVVALDRTRVRERAVERFRPARMVGEHVAAYRQVVAERRGLEGAAT